MSYAQPSNQSPRIRQAAMGTAIGAALMLFFGFARLAKPTGSDLFGYASLVLFYALRFGGLISAGIAVWLWVGHRSALLVDAVVAVILGSLFVLSGIAMLLDGGDAFQSAIVTICGGTFVSSGIRNGRIYLRLTDPGDVSGPRSGRIEARENSRPVQHQPDQSSSALKSPEPRNASHRPTDRPSDRQSIGSALATKKESSSSEKESASANDSGVEPLPEGFLASFARKDPPS